MRPRLIWICPGPWCLLVVLGGLQAFSCAGVKKSGEQGDGGTRPPGVGATGGTGGGTPPPVSTGCQGLDCNKTTCVGRGCTQQPCGAGMRTTVTGVVYDPAGKVPLYNVVVYVPSLPLEDAEFPRAFVDGVTCDRCTTRIQGASAVALTDASGAFRLEDVPVGTNVPLVMQVGKWRRQVRIASVAACTTTALTDRNLTRLPRNQREGRIPKIALTTGGLDALECWLRKVGLEDAEFTPEAGNGRVNLFAGGTHLGLAETQMSAGTNAYAAALNGGALFTDAETWWNNVDNLKKYDVVLHSCDGNPVPQNKSVAALEALQAYANVGGRVFASHWHNYWIRGARAPLSTIGSFTGGDYAFVLPIYTFIDTTFPKGEALADWLVNVGASTRRGYLEIVGAKRTVGMLDSMLAQRWIYEPTSEAVEYLSANTPVGAPANDQCGRIVFSDLHVTTGAASATDDRSSPALPFPTGCVTTDLSPQEKALEFMLFELSSCIRRDDMPPVVE